MSWGKRMLVSIKMMITFMSPPSPSSGRDARVHQLFGGCPWLLQGLMRLLASPDLAAGLNAAACACQVLFKMLNTGFLREINGCISTGKEANVYHATGAGGADLAVKVYKTSILAFKDRDRWCCCLPG